MSINSEKGYCQIIAVYHKNTEDKIKSLFDIKFKIYGSHFKVGYYPEIDEYVLFDLEETTKHQSVKFTGKADSKTGNHKATRKNACDILADLGRSFYTKRQSTVETSTYGTEIISTRIPVEKILESGTLKSKLNAVTYYKVMEAVIAEFMKVTFISIKNKEADIFIKIFGSKSYISMMKNMIFKPTLNKVLNLKGSCGSCVPLY